MYFSFCRSFKAFDRGKARFSTLRSLRAELHVRRVKSLHRVKILTSIFRRSQESPQRDDPRSLFPAFLRQFFCPEIRFKNNRRPSWTPYWKFDLRRSREPLILLRRGFRCPHRESKDYLAGYLDSKISTAAILTAIFVF